MLLSLDGMDWNFEEIRGTIESALRKAEMSHFQVLKQESGAAGFVLIFLMIMHSGILYN